MNHGQAQPLCLKGVVSHGQDGHRSPSPKNHMKRLKTPKNTVKMGAPQRSTLLVFICSLGFKLTRTFRRSLRDGISPHCFDKGLVLGSISYFCSLLDSLGCRMLGPLGKQTHALDHTKALTEQGVGSAVAKEISHMTMVLAQKGAIGASTW